MLKSTIRFALALACLFLAAGAPGHGQTAPAPATTNAAATNAPATNAPAAAPAAKPFAIGDVVAQVQAAATQLQNLQAGLDPDTTLQEVNDDLPKLTDEIDAQTAEDKQQSEGSATLNSLEASQSNWQSISDDLNDAQVNLAKRVDSLNKDLGDLAQMDAKWKATLDAAGAAKAPGEIMGRITAIRTSIAAATKAIRDHLTPIYALQSKVGDQDARVKNALDTVNRDIATARQQLFERNRPELWDPEALAHPAAGIVGLEKQSLDQQGAEVTAYLKEKSGAVLIHALIFAMLIFGFFWIRNTVRLRAKTEPALQGAAHVFDVPLANALLIGLLAGAWLYPAQPRLLWAALGALALIPTVIVTRRLIEKATLPILYATVIAFLVDQLRYVITPAGIVSRFLFIFELLAASVFLLVALRFKHLSPQDPEQSLRKQLTRLYLHVAFLVLVFAGFANVLGYIKLSILVGNGMLDSSYLAVVLYAAVRIVDALAISAMSIRPLSRLGMVRRHHDLLYTNVTIGIRWAFFAIWFLGALQFFSQLNYLWDQGNAVLWKQYPVWFSLKLSPGAVLAFPVTIWASFLVSRFVRFLLDEEVYPHMALSRGIPYAASTMVHYTVLLFGFFAAVAATGTELSQFAFLAGAFGVGLGFGLQNIVNNFVSGVILLFERPIKVGDTVQIDPATMGRVERIGIRASVILLANGAEVIVPNGNLISNPVTNWTLSNCERQIEIPVTVAAKADPDHIISLLTKIAIAHPDVIRNPAPRAYLVTFAAAALTFRLTVWIDSAEEWMKVTSDLSLAINSELAKENIALG